MARVAALTVKAERKVSSTPVSQADSGALSSGAVLRPGYFCGSGRGFGRD